MSRIFISEEEAIDLLPEGESVHTFMNAPFVLIGADWERDEVIQKIKNSGRKEIAGDGARGLNHGLALWNDGDCQMDVLFVETDMEKLDSRYPAEICPDDN